MDIDIIILTRADRGISKETLVSLAKFAADCRIILCPNDGVNWTAGERLINYRLPAIKKATADWVYFLDDDDELLRSFPDVKQLEEYDYVLLSLCDKGKVRFLETCSSQRAFGFHMILAKREAAIAALEYAYNKQLWSADPAYCVWLVENCKGAKTQRALVQKNGDRIPFEVAGFREGTKQENRKIWRDRLLRIRHNILPGMLQI